MSRAAKFTQADIKRAVAAVKAVGETVRSVDIRPDGTISVLTGSSAPKQPLTPLEAWELAQEHGDRAA